MMMMKHYQKAVIRMVLKKMIKPTVMDAALFDRWMVENLVIAETTRRIYFFDVKLFLTTSPDLENLEDYNNFLIEYTQKKRNISYYYAIKHFIEYKIPKNELRERLIDGLLRPQRRFDIKQERKYLPEEKILEVLNLIEEDRFRIVALIQMITGVRAADVLRIKTDSIALEEYEGKETLKLSVLGKGRKRHVVYIHDAVAQKVIMNYVTNSTVFYEDYVFLKPSRNRSIHRMRPVDGPMQVISKNYNDYLFTLKTALKSAGVNMKMFATHDFRRCFARRVWTKWKDVAVLQSLLNHANISTSLCYLRQSGLQNIDYFKVIQNIDDGGGVDEKSKS